jgi:putative endonuclease
MFTLYILYSRSAGKTYVGFTNDISRRILEHNVTEKRGFTLRYRPWELIHEEVFETKVEAMQKEKFYKTGKGRDEIKLIVSKFIANNRDSGAVSAAAEKD